ncbi:Putative ribonuclease H protein At1g65750 [Linum perenne]
MKNGARSGLSWMRWERLCVRKEFGGMGFRDLHGFNLAMLGKSRYFPGGDFLSAPKGYGPSPIWQSIWATQVETPRDDELRGLRVCDLFIPGLREWDVELVRTLFNDRDASSILSIPLRAHSDQDTRIWHFSRKGDYTVRSCYRLIMERLAPRDYLHTPGPWRKIWDIDAPPRLRCFAWRIGQEVLPTRMALHNRHISVPSTCGICSQALEHSWHLFLRCPFASRCWDNAGLTILIEECMQDAESMRDWLFKLVSGEDNGKIAQVIAIMGAIWRERNNRVWNDLSSEPFAVVREGLEGLHNWERAKVTVNNASIRSLVCDRWHPPPEGKLKCNIDAALFQEAGRWGMGAVLRDTSGNLLQYRMSSADGCPNPTECEALALIESINWLSLLPYNNIILELDSLTVVQAMESMEEDDSELGMIIDEARRSLPPSWSVNFVRRNGNSTAHTIARHSRHLAFPIVSNASPTWLIDTLGNTCFSC